MIDRIKVTKYLEDLETVYCIGYERNDLSDENALWSKIEAVKIILSEQFKCTSTVIKKY